MTQEKPVTDPGIDGIFGHFKILDQIGKGGMGKVYKVIDLNTKNILALKILHRKLHDLLPRFFKEAKVIANLRHPNIVKFYEFGQVDNQYYFTMEYIDGETFDKYINKKNIAEGLEILKKIATALHYVHTLNLIHRDIKPSNIMIDKNGNPYVMDFGIVKDIGEDEHLTKTGMIIGTPGYMSPEQLKGQKNIDHRSDIYSLGTIMYELLTQELPFGNSLASIMTNMIRNPNISVREINTKVSDDLEAICLKTITFRRNRRYSSAQELADDIQRYQKGIKVYAEKENDKNNKKTVFLLSASIVIVILITITIAVFFVKGASSSPPQEKEEKVELAPVPSVAERYQIWQEQIKTYRGITTTQECLEVVMLLKEINIFVIKNENIAVAEYTNFIEQTNYLRSLFIEALMSGEVKVEERYISEWNSIVECLDLYFASFEQNWRQTRISKENMMQLVLLYLNLKAAVQEMNIAKEDLIILKSNLIAKYTNTYEYAMAQSVQLLDLELSNTDIELFLLNTASHAFFVKESFSFIFPSKEKQAQQIWSSIIGKLKNIANQNATVKIFLLLLEGRVNEPYPQFAPIYYLEVLQMLQKYLGNLRSLPKEYQGAYITVCHSLIDQACYFAYAINGRAMNQQMFMTKLQMNNTKTSAIDIAWSFRTRVSGLLISIPNYEEDWIINESIANKVLYYTNNSISWNKGWREAYIPHIVKKLELYEKGKLSENKTPFEEINLLKNDIDNIYTSLLRLSKYCSEYSKK